MVADTQLDHRDRWAPWRLAISCLFWMDMIRERCEIHIPIGWIHGFHGTDIFICIYHTSQASMERQICHTWILWDTCHTGWWMTGSKKVVYEINSNWAVVPLYSSTNQSFHRSSNELAKKKTFLRLTNYQWLSIQSRCVSTTVHQRKHWSKKFNPSAPNALRIKTTRFENPQPKNHDCRREVCEHKGKTVSKNGQPLGPSWSLGSAWYRLRFGRFLLC